MDLSKTQKTKRDAVEAPLILTEQLLDQLEEIGTRLEAATTVWPDTKRTLQPVLARHHELTERLEDLQNSLAFLWKQGAKVKWKTSLSKLSKHLENLTTGSDER